MKVTAMKTTFEKPKPNIHYKDYRTLSSDRLRENLLLQLLTESVRVDCNDTERFYKYVSVRWKNITTNRAFMKRSLKNCLDNNKPAQTNYCVLLLRKAKKKSYANLNEKDLNNKNNNLANRKTITF